MNVRTIVRVAATVALAFAAGGLLPGRAAAAGKDEGPDAFAQNRRLGRGVNVLGYDPIWKNREHARFKAEYFRAIREAGFQHVRINLHPLRDGAEDGGRLRESYARTLDWAVDQALANDLLVILDFHEFTMMSKDPAGLKGRFLAFWADLAAREKDRPPAVLFELLNEPNGKYTAELWNETLREALAVVRKTNPTRTVVIGPVHWNSIKELPSLSLPSEDRNLIATVHYYNPFPFTHQGASWANLQGKLGVRWTGTEAERAAVRKDFDPVEDWSRKENRPIYLGEFGTYDKAEMPSRARWTSDVAREAESRGWSWGYWQFDGDFIVFDVRADRWVEPIRDALIPPTR